MRKNRFLFAGIGKDDSMADNKQTYKLKNSKNTANKKNVPSKAENNRNTKNAKAIPPQSEARRVWVHNFIPVFLILGAILLIVSFWVENFGVIGNFIRDYIFFGLFSGGAYLCPLFLIVTAVVLFAERFSGKTKSKMICTFIIFIVVLSLFHVFFSPEGTEKLLNPITHYVNGLDKVGGGFVGGLVGALFVTCFSKIGAAVIFIAAFVILAMIVAGKTPRDVWKMIKKRYEKKKMLRLEREEAEAEARKRGERYISEDSVVEYYDGGDIPPADNRYTAQTGYIDEKYRKTHFDPDITGDDFTSETQLENPPEDEIPDHTDGILPVADLRSGEVLDVEEDEPLFDNPEDEDVLRRLSETYLGHDNVPENTMKVTKTDLTPTLDKGDVVDIPVAPVKKEYAFPGISLLTPDKEKRNTDNRKELSAKEAKLIQTLEKFNVHTESAGLPARGPAITRYELRPAPGTRVRAIVNLVDDIALSLATSGIRIEAPIPGKSAVGIEVPNDERKIVRLRTLIENGRFKEATSKINVALGEDVAGEPVYIDIAKMPHLLIAGATGMGKSVCINSLIVSLLYKATPDEVKLILIDPKKVEFNMYSGLPHLLVPVVSDPKKAAGSLSWAVTEMERRYSLIEEVGARNIFGYNEDVADDPTKEKLSQIVIIIDELADLMMTAPDSVEDSICRLAQKARAAGMHLIIGTQRPSVDVITGTIKSNIPSRIACTVASQVDSRTIIDMVGAEKLIGQGDMLYSPVGSIKPIRVQGAFVSENEVESVVAFIKKQNVTETCYSDDVMAKIESEAAKCLSKKKSADVFEGAPEGDCSEEDPMFWRAVELAVESGKISTSLIQRKCSLGFGRAAKLIDRMESLGYVSAPDGQKPRQVLITRERLAELKMGGADNSDDTEEF